MRNDFRETREKNKIHFFYNQLVFKQLALGWKIAKQVSSLISLLQATIKTTD